MIHRRFGRTELAMPVFSCGGMRYQQLWEDAGWDKVSPENQRNLEATIHRALEVGINHIETARGYGTSELQLGRILPTLPREDIIVQTKITPASAAEFCEKFDRSLSLLNLDSVDLLSIHGINNEDLLQATLARDGALVGANELRRQGRARFIGFSTHAPCDVITRTLATGAFDYVNLHYYWINQTNLPALKEAARQDAGVFIISPSDKGGKLYEPPQRLVDLCAPLTPMQFNDLFCLLHPEIHTLSIGAARPADFDTHVQALAHLDAAHELVTTIQARLDFAIDSALGAEWRTQWQQGLPLWNEVPGEINITEILRMWTLVQGLEMNAYGKMRYNMLGSGGHWFPGRKAENFSDNELLPLLERNPFAARIPSILREAHASLNDAPAERLGSH